MEAIYDIAIIGGGVNGCGIARDAAGRGASVYLCEMNDLASGTSSAATKLIHGGLRYLEHYEFRLVREALTEREILWSLAPHIIWPLRFVLPHHKGLRPAWLLRLGLFLYDHLGGRKLLPATRRVNFATDPTGKPLKHGDYSFGFEYSDCWVEDARLVVLNAQDAVEHGATVRTRTRAVSARRVDDVWELTTEHRLTGARETIRAKILVNAGGPWAGDVLHIVPELNQRAKVRLVQGSHIVVPKLYDHDRCYIFQNSDGRIIFAVPYETDFTLIGTTDRDYHGDPSDVKATPEEISYMCAAASEYFEKPVTEDQVVWAYSGVRPLYDDGATAAQEATRDYVLNLDTTGGAPLLSIFGGKLTTYRRLALSALEKLAPFMKPEVAAATQWSKSHKLPGGDFAVQGFEELMTSVLKRYPWLQMRDCRRLTHAYGTRIDRVLQGANSYADLGRDFGWGLSEAEVRYLMAHEWAVTADDILWRRSKLGLRLTRDQAAALDTYMQEARAHLAA